LIFGPLASRSDAVVFVCGTQRDHWTGNYRIDSRKAVVIANGVDVAQYRPRFSPGERAAFRNMLGFDTESFVICNCSAFRPEKRQTDLIAAAKVLRGRGADVRVLLVGDGGERCRIVRCIDDMGMRASVCLAGYQSDVRPYLECADAVVNCSRAESLSMAILEAMAMGRALVCTDVGGTGEQVAEQVNGFLYEPGDVQALADRIALLFEPGLRARFGAASREMAESTFSLHAMVSGYQQLFERMP
jgi:glycosyltransferase involved in cell wall biosynthesis